MLSAQQLMMLRHLDSLLTRPAVVSARQWVCSRYVAAMTVFKPYKRKREVKTITINTEQDVGNRLSACKPYGRGVVTRRTDVTGPQGMQALRAGK